MAITTQQALSKFQSGAWTADQYNKWAAAYAAGNTSFDPTVSAPTPAPTPAPTTTPTSTPTTTPTTIQGDTATYTQPTHQYNAVTGQLNPNYVTSTTPSTPTSTTTAFVNKYILDSMSGSNAFSTGGVGYIKENGQWYRQSDHARVVTDQSQVASTLTPEQISQGYSTIPGPYDPITGQLKDTSSTTGNTELDQLLTTLQSYLDNLTTQGQTINPNIDISPEMIQQFLTQAEQEISPYYAGQLKAIKDDLSAGLKELSASYELAKQERESTFRQSLGLQREAEAGAGTIFSGREQPENKNLLLELKGL